jgi:hypothetical protein
VLYSWTIEASSCRALIFSAAASACVGVEYGPTRTRIWRVLALSSFMTDGSPASSSLAWALAAFSGTEKSPTLIKNDLLATAWLDAAAEAFLAGSPAGVALGFFAVLAFSGSLAGRACAVGADAGALLLVLAGFAFALLALAALAGGVAVGAEAAGAEVVGEEALAAGRIGVGALASGWLAAGAMAGAEAGISDADAGAEAATAEAPAADAAAEAA